MNMKKKLDLNRRAFRLLYRLNPRYMIGNIGRSLFSAVVLYVPVWFSAKIIDALASGAGGKTLGLYAGLTVGLTALLSLLTAFFRRWEDTGMAELNRSVDWLHAEKAMSMAYSTMEDRKVALLRERIQMETQTGYNLFYYCGAVSQYIRYSVQILASVSMTVSLFRLDAVSAGAKLGLLGGTLLTVAVSILTAKQSGKLRNRFYASCVDSNILGDRLFDYMSDYSSGKDIRLYGMAEDLTELERKFCGDVYRGERVMNFGTAWMGLIATFVTHLLRFGVYLLLISAALSGGLSVGSIAKYVSCIMLLLTAISGFVRTVGMSSVNREFMQRFLDYFDIPNLMYKGTLSTEKRDDNDYTIEFRDVSFRYPNTESYALRHVSLKFRIGEKLAVVGMNGSGKTTFIKLLCRLYDPTEGVILLNGVDIRKYDYEEYMEIFSVVFQDFRLFAFSLGQNVAAGADYDRTRCEACLTEAGFGERLSKMPKGLETNLYREFDPSGVEISGGEAQKIAIARALYKNAPFIVLDEPTAALDPESEYEVYRKFNEISGGKTAIYISHRLASCRFCDEILVFDRGSIVQHGTHESLLNQPAGKYAELWNAQAQYYTE